jgi:hypothetical protein
MSTHTSTDFIRSFETLARDDKHRVNNKCGGYKAVL